MEFGSSRVFLNPPTEELGRTRSVSARKDTFTVRERYFREDGGEYCIISVLDTVDEEECTVRISPTAKMSRSKGADKYQAPSRTSFEDVDRFVQNIRRLGDCADSLPIMIIGNKADLEDRRQVTFLQGQELAINLGASFRETSAKLGTGVEEAFFDLIRMTPRHGKNFKMAVVGSRAAGKTALTLYFQRMHFIGDLVTAPEECYVRQACIHGLQDPMPCSSSETNVAQFGTRKQRHPATSNELNTDTNILLLPMDSLSEHAKVASQPVCCKKCKAVMSHLSAVYRSKTADQSWRCEFCGKRNLLLGRPRVPRKHVVDHILSPSTHNEFTTKTPFKYSTAKSIGNSGGGVLVLLIDVSSSMGTCDPLPEASVPTCHQYERRTRLDIVKTHLIKLIRDLRSTSPNKRVVMVIFGSSTRVISFVLRRKVKRKSFQVKYNDADTLEDIMDNQQACPSVNWERILPLSQCFDSTIATIGDLVTQDDTSSLPHALAVTLGLVKHSTERESEIALFTDGMSPVQYWEDVCSLVARQARALGCLLSLVGIEGNASTLNTLSSCAAMTGGAVTIESSQLLVREMERLARKDVTGRNVVVTVSLHKHLQLDDSAFKGSSQAVLELSSVTCGTDLFFHFSLRPEYRRRFKRYAAAKKAGGEPNKSSKAMAPPKAYPFQVQVEYEAPDGGRYLRVMSRSIRTTTRRSRAEQGIDVSVVVSATMRRSSELGWRHRASDAFVLLHASTRMLERACVSDEQREELSLFTKLSAPMRKELHCIAAIKGDLDLDRAKLLFCKGNWPRFSFLSWERKKELCYQRVRRAR